MNVSRMPPSRWLSRPCVVVLFMMIIMIPGSDRYYFVNAQTPQYDQTLNGLPAMYYSWNPNCAAMGYDFGYKMEGCFPGTNIRFDSLERTKGASCASNNNFDGVFDLDCLDSDDDQWRTASITPSSSSLVVMMKGGPGGVIYSGLEADTAYNLDVGSRKGISHIEFCFSCTNLEEAEQVLESVLTSNPALYPTSRPTTPAPTLPPPTTPGPTVRPPTTNKPTLARLPTQCFDCGFETPPPKFEEEQPQEVAEEEEEEELVLISSTVAPAVPTARPQLPDEIELISAQVVETRSGASALVTHPGGRRSVSSSMGAFLLLTLVIMR